MLSGKWHCSLGGKNENKKVENRKEVKWKDVSHHCTSRSYLERSHQKWFLKSMACQWALSSFFVEVLSSSHGIGWCPSPSSVVDWQEMEVHIRWRWWRCCMTFLSLWSINAPPGKWHWKNHPARKQNESNNHPMGCSKVSVSGGNNWQAGFVTSLKQQWTPSVSLVQPLQQVQLRLV